MTDDEPDSLILPYLRRLDAKVDRIDGRLDDLAADVRGVKAHMAGFMHNEFAQGSALPSLRGRLDKVERRLDLRERDA